VTPLFTFSYDLDTAGWSTATVSDGAHTVTLTASYLSDALGDLTRAVIALLQGAEGATLAWQEEPGVIEWRFERQGDDVVVCLTRFADNTSYRRSQARPGEPTFNVSCPLTRLGGEVLDELWHIHETVGVDGYKERWKRHPFPLQEYRQLRALLRERSRRHGAHGNADARP
jgi:hypothetical protein